MITPLPCDAVETRIRHAARSPASRLMSLNEEGEPVAANEEGYLVIQIAVAGHAAHHLR
jgi:hypothetical protein